MIIMLFDLYEHRLRDIDTVESCIHTDSDEENTCSISAHGVPDEAEYAAFKDIDGNFQLFFIASRDIDAITGKQVLYCENAMYELATDAPLADVRPTNVQAGAAVTMALAGTRWQLGTTVETAQASARWFYINPHAALQSVVETWGVYLRPRIMVSGAAIVGRYIDVVSKEPVWRGKRFEIGKDVLSSRFTIDKRNIATAIVPRGKGEASGDGYTARIGIADVVWSKAQGKPADKPAGQTYIEKPEATAMYGIAGTRPRIAVKVYEDIEDPNELIQSAWDDLQTACEPVLSGNVTVFDLERVGFPHEAARYGDRVAFISDGLRYTSTIVGIKREYAQNGKDVFTFGAHGESNARQLYGIQRTLNSVNDKAGAGAQIAQQNPDLLRGIIDTTVTQILSSVTRRYTDTDGGDVYETADGTKAVKLTGAGILCANSKVGDAWQWRTAIDGSGIVANMITSGVLQASLVRILGTDRFYWDSSNITIIDTENSNKQIRIGLYDGVHYGIGYTANGGQSWVTAMDFSGLRVPSLNVSGLASVATSGSYDDLLNKPSIPGMQELTLYIKEGQIIGAQPAAGATGFTVSQQGLLQASNAVIYGTIYASAGEFAGNLTADTTYCNNLMFRSGKRMRIGYIVVNDDGLYYTYNGEPLNSRWWVDKDTDGDMHMHSAGCFYFDSNPSSPMFLNAGSFWFLVTGNNYGIGLDTHPGYNHVSFVPRDDRTCNLGCGPISSQGVASRIFDYAGIRYIYCPEGVHAGSSRTIKHDIEPISDAGEIIDKLEPVRFVLNADKQEKKRIGLIYEDTKPILPEICDEQVEGDMSTAGIDYAALAPLLLKEIQSLRARVSALEGERAHGQQ